MSKVAAADLVVLVMVVLDGTLVMVDLVKKLSH